MFRLLATKLRSQWRARSVPSGCDLEIDTSAPLNFVKNDLGQLMISAHAEKYRPRYTYLSINR
jgi:hypothetical protein